MNIQAIGHNTSSQTIQTSSANDDFFQNYIQNAIRKDSTDKAKIGSYQIFTDSSASSEYQDTAQFHDINGIRFNDEIFAREIAFRKPALINTSKKINWAARGEHTLNEEEIDYLKNQYDITNLSPQEFYDLMADLTNLDAISAAEAVSKYCSINPDPYWDSETALGMVGSFIAYQRYTKKSCNNIIEGLLGSKFYFTGALEHIKTKDFAEQLLFERHPDLLAEFEPRYQAAYEGNERMLSIFSQLIRDDSPWKKYIEESEILLKNGFFEKLDTNMDNNTDNTFLDEIIRNPQNELLSINSILGLRHCKYSKDEWDLSFTNLLKTIFTFHEEVFRWLPLK